LRSGHYHRKAAAVMNRFVLALAMIVAACGSAKTPAPLAGATIGGPFSLTNQNGQAVTDKSYPSQYRIMYFGYTFCPDVCPTDVATLARGLKVFAKADPVRAAKVKLIFVSVDPGRDTPSRLKEFAAAFDPNMAALTGTTKAIEDTAKAYGIAFSILPGQSKDNYLVDHSRVAYLMDPDNKPIALLPQDGPAQGVADELAKWVG
jgi:protein SCO1